MSLFTYHMPPFLIVMGVFYLLAAFPILVGFIKDGYWSGVFGEFFSMLRNNLHWCAGAIAITFVLIAFVDIPATLAVKHLEIVTQSYTFWDFISSCAEGGFVGGFLFTLFMLSKQFKWLKLAEVVKISLMSSILGGLSNGILKFLFNRQRPSIGLEQWHFFAFFKDGAEQFNNLLYAYNSMPSGHTITTLAAITPFFLAYRNKFIRTFLLIWALLVCFARVYTINHWLSDVFIASLLGVLIGLASFRVNQKRLIIRVK